MSLEEELKSKFTEDVMKNLVFLSDVSKVQSRKTLILMKNMDSDEFKQQAYKEYRIEKLWYEEAIKAKDSEVITEEQLLKIKKFYLDAKEFVKKYTEFSL